MGMSGLLGFGAAYQAMHDCDPLLLLGTDFPYDKFLPMKQRLFRSILESRIWTAETNWISDYWAT